MHCRCRCWVLGVRSWVPGAMRPLFFHCDSLFPCDICHRSRWAWFDIVLQYGDQNHRHLRRPKGLASCHGPCMCVYRCTGSFPKQEIYGLTSQMRRSAVSIPSNIAEGKGRYSRKELLQFLFHARGSLLELRTQLTIAKELGFLGSAEGETLTDLAGEVGLASKRSHQSIPVADRVRTVKS